MHTTKRSHRPAISTHRGTNRGTAPNNPALCQSHPTAARHRAVSLLGVLGLLALIIFAFTPHLLRAQTATGSIVGTVTDTSGRAIVGATVTLTDANTGETRVTKTDSDGAYALTLLNPATYNISIASPGFGGFEQKGIILNVGATLNINAALKVGAVSQRVTVSGQPSELELHTSSLGQVIPTKTILDLPINGRNSYAFAALVPGVIPSAGFTQTAVDEYNDQFISINGSRPNQNLFLLDGGINTQPALNGPGFYPSIDLVKEYKVQTNNYSAQFSNTSGGIINVITKSGSNQFHGSAYEFLRNNYFDARDFFINQAVPKIPTPPYRFNQFGGTVGGPIFRNHTFFFFSYEGLRCDPSVTTTATLPTVAERNGNFSATGSQIYNPFTTTPLPGGGFVRQPFANDTIPASMFDPVAKNLLAYLPVPNGPGLFNNFTNASSAPIDKNDFSIRVDQQLTSNSKLFGIYSISTTHQDRPPIYGNTPNFAISAPELGNDTLRQMQATVDDTTVISPTLVLELNSSFVRFHLARTPRGLGFNPTTLGFPSYFNELSARSVPCFPTMVVGGFGNSQSIPNIGWGGFMGQLCWIGILNDANQVYNETGNLTKVFGNHTFKFGADFGIGYFTTARFNNVAGFYLFGQDFTQGPSPFNSNSGNGFASFLLGTGDGGFNLTGGPDEINSFRYYGGYFQDDWKVAPRLTLNLGLRYDYNTPWRERFNRITDFDMSATSPVSVPGLTLKGGLTFPGVNGLSRYQFNPDYRTGIQPRIGFAVGVGHDSVVRGGYGIFMGPVVGSGYNNNEVPISGWQGQSNWVYSLNGVTPHFPFSNPFPNGWSFPTGSKLGLNTDLGQIVQGSDRTRKTSYTQQWNLDFQHTFPDQILFDLAYAGSHGVHLYGDWNADQLPDNYLSMGSALLDQVPNPFFGNPLIKPGILSGPTVARSQLLLPFPQFQGVTLSGTSFYGASSYNSLQLKVERRFANGFSVLGAYTWSKLMDNVNPTTTGFPGGNFQGGGIQDFYNLKAAWAASVMDTPNYATIYSMWAPPFGKGRKWLHNSTAANYIAGGWQLNGIFSAISGNPQQIFMASNTLFNNGGVQLANWNGRDPSGHGPIKDRLSHYFNVSDFSNPGAFTYGNAPRTISSLLSPGVLNLDTSVLKTFPLTEGTSLQLRFEAFNVFNHPQFGPPDDALGSGQPTGVISFQANQPRILQVAAKILF